jgi:N,N-dimethylformamidase beta subunit-like, C-terminal
MRPKRGRAYLLLIPCAGLLALQAIRAPPSAAHPGLATRAERRTATGVSQVEIAGVFTQRSYAPETRAWLRIWARTRTLTGQIFISGPGSGPFHGRPVTGERTWSWADSSWPRGRSIRVGSWPSGLYFIRLTARDGRVGFAPFIVRPGAGSRPPPIGIVLSTNTWQAYNFRDMDGNGVGDTWYADPSIHVVKLVRPYLPPGMPPAAGRGGVFPFLRWLYRHGKSADFYADDDFARFPSKRWLARRYALVVFAGHEEYVTPTEYDLTTAARNRGLNLEFNSANNFFYRVTRSGNRLYGRTRWRDLGRPEAALVGVQYVGWWQGIFPMRRYVVKGARVAPWAFTGTGLSNGDRFGRFGIEVDARAPSSPRGVKLLARIKDIFGPGKSAEMTYYRTARGAKVWAAGVLNFTRHADWPVIDKLLANIFAKLEVR